jgi:hypothetical protein
MRNISSCPKKMKNLNRTGPDPDDLKSRIRKEIFKVEYDMLKKVNKPRMFLKE